MDIKATQFLRQGVSVAEYFGFRPLDELKRATGARADKSKAAHPDSIKKHRLDPLSKLLMAGWQSYRDGNLDNHEGPVCFYEIKSMPRTGEASLSLHIFNVEKSIAEAILVQTMRALVEELGYSDYIVRLNSFGDKDSAARFTRDLNSHLRRNLSEMPEVAREMMKEHVPAALAYLVDRDHALIASLPSPLGYLSDQSRKHFREIIEFLDMSEVAYEIDCRLTGHHEYQSETIFTLDLLADDGTCFNPAPVLIRGSRYGGYVEEVNGDLVPAAGAVAVLSKKPLVKQPHRERLPKPSLYVVQLGFGPKLKSLLLVEQLRQAGIRAHHDFTNDSLSAQLRAAEDAGVPRAVIIGQKEFINNVVILRDLKARNQELIPIPQLVGRLKRFN